MPSQSVSQSLACVSEVNQTPCVLAHIFSQLPSSLTKKTSDVQVVDDLSSPNANRGVTDLLSLPKSSQEKIAKKEMKAISKEELSRLWQYSDPQLKSQAKAYFEMMADPNWRLVSVNKSSQVWRLPGEKIHRIMGVADVNKTPNYCMDCFKDPYGMFKTIFPKVDTMFIKGTVLEADTRRGHALCQALFFMPNIVGNGAAPGIQPREMLWRQTVGKLPTGNVLVSVKSADEATHQRVAPLRGSIRGEILTSGYYGRVIKVAGGKPPLTQQSRVWYIVQADPKGILPKWLVNLCATKQAANVIRLKQLFSN